MLEIHNCLVDAVKKRLMSDRPIGCVLSGGLDSTIITAIVSKLMKEHDNKRVLNTYTIGFEGAEDFKWAKLASEHFGTKHNEFVCSHEEFLNSIPTVIEQIESYDTTTVRASVGNWLLGKKIKAKGIDTVIFCGDVSDELFGGYRGFGLAEDKENFYNENKKMMSNIHFFDVLRAEKCMAGHALECRVPFGDKDFIKLIMSLPVEYKMWGNKSYKNVLRPTNILCKGEPEQIIEKHILRLAFQDYLPPALLWRRKEAFSDGVSKTTNSWSNIIQKYIINNDHINKLINEKKYSNLFDSLTTYSYESKYYKLLYYLKYGQTKHVDININIKPIPYFWKHPFTDINEPSARALNNY